MDQNAIIYVSVAGAVTAVGYFLSRLFVGSGDEKLRERLSNAAQGVDALRSGKGQTVMPVLEKIGTAAAQPFMPSSREKQSSLRRELGRAGIYSPSAARLVIGSKVILLFVGLAVGYAMGIVAEQTMMGLSLGGLIGYLLPRFWLKRRISKNQVALQLALPDALDLMVVCVEAGLTVDSAMQRVGQELALAHPSLARELGIAHMETRVGLSRMEAMKNLGVRTGSESLQSLAAMLIQAERFGTSIANALRVQADSLRSKRQLAAEEMAAKASVKLSFPLVLFIFPSTFIVLAGPTVIGLMKSALFND
ncbi:MAG: type II secretion system F family protein [Tepidisphaeraceae bacterium]